MFLLLKTVAQTIQIKWNTNLKRLFRLKSLLVRGEIPEGRGSEPGVRLLDAGQLVHALRDLADVCLDLNKEAEMSAEVIFLQAKLRWLSSHIFVSQINNLLNLRDTIFVQKSWW